MPFIDTRGIFGPAGTSYSDGRYNNQNDYDTWTDPKVLQVDKGINAATGLPFTRADQGFGSYAERADVNGRAEAARQAAADDDGFMGLGDLGTLAMLAAAIYSGGTALGAWGAGAGAAGTGVGSIVPSLAESFAASYAPAAWAGTAGAAGAGALGAAEAAGGAMDFSNLGDLWNFGEGGASSLADLQSAANQFGWSDLASVGTEAGANADIAGSGWLNTIVQQAIDNPLSTAGNLLKTVTGSSNTSDWTKLLGNLAGAGLGAYASNEQTGALEDMAARYEGYGAPYRQKLSDLYANPESFLSSAEVQKPVQMGTDALMRSLSVQGNPFGSGNALQQGQSYASDQLFGKLGQEKDRLAGFGGLANYNAAAPQVATNAVQSSGNMYNAIGSGLGNIFNPPKSGAQTLADLLKQLG